MRATQQVAFRVAFLAALTSHAVGWGRLAGCAHDAVGLAHYGAAVTLAYALDRLPNRNVEDAGAHAYAQYGAGALNAIVMALAALGVLCTLALRPTLFGPTLGFALAGHLYTHEVPLVRVRLKNLFPCSKTIVVGGMHVAWVVATSTCDASRPSVLGAMFLHAASVTVLNDLKDIDADARAGIVTIPNLVGEQGTRLVLLGACAGAALACANRVSVVFVADALALWTCGDRLRAPALILALWAVPPLAALAVP